jgi:hypothetical protein
MTLKIDLSNDDDASSPPPPQIDLDSPFLGVSIDPKTKFNNVGPDSVSALPANNRHNPKNFSAPLPNNIYSSATALKLAAILSEYDKQIVRDAVQLRNYITNKLLSISDSGNTRDELRALELLGKISDIGLFVEKSEIKVTHTASTELENTLRGKIEKILKAKQFSNERAEIEDGQVIDLSVDDYEPPIEPDETTDDDAEEDE